MVQTAARINPMGLHVDGHSAYRISKGQGYQSFLRKRAGAALAKKGQFASYKENLEKRTIFHSF
jgi:hypothetical protein